MNRPLQASAPLLVTAREAAQMLAISERTLWSLSARGDLKAIKLGRAKRYSVAELVAFIERKAGP